MKENHGLLILMGLALLTSCVKGSGAIAIKTSNPETITATPTPLPLELDSSWTPEWNSIVGIWHLDEAAGTSGYDSGITFGTPGEFGVAASFDQSGSAYIDLGNLGNFPTEGSLAFWMNPALVQSYINPMCTGGFYGANTGIRFEEDTGGVFGVVFGNDNGTFMGHTFTNSLTANNWYHVVLTWDETQNKVWGYLNGTTVFNGDNQVYWPSQLGDVILGAGYSNTRTYNGKLQEVSIWSTALSASEAQTIYNHQKQN